MQAAQGQAASYYGAQGAPQQQRSGGYDQHQQQHQQQQYQQPQHQGSYPALDSRVPGAADPNAPGAQGERGFGTVLAGGAAGAVSAVAANKFMGRKDDNSNNPHNPNAPPPQKQGMLGSLAAGGAAGAGVALLGELIKVSLRPRFELTPRRRSATRTTTMTTTGRTTTHSSRGTPSPTPPRRTGTVLALAPDTSSSRCSALPASLADTATLLTIVAARLAVIATATATGTTTVATTAARVRVAHRLRTTRVRARRTVTAALELGRGTLATLRMVAAGAMLVDTSHQA